MIGTIEAFYRDAAPLVARFSRFVSKHSLTTSARADHICFKCSTSREFERMRSLFEEKSVFIYQSIISARRIAVIRLPRPFATALGLINYLELSDQKPDKSQKSGFDHVEIYPTKLSYAALVKKIGKGGVVMKKVVRPHHTTVDIEIGDGYLVRLENEPLIDKIKREEMR